MTLDPSYPQRQWFRHNAGLFILGVSGDAAPVPFNAHAAHCEVWFATNPSFNGQLTIYGVPTNTTQDASNMAVYVDGVFNQTVVFDIGANFNKQQSLTVNVGTTGAHTIRIQEGERDPGVFLTRVVIDGSIIPAPAITRQYTTFGDSVSMGAFSSPRSSGWAPSMRFGSRFDGFAMLGQSGYAMSIATTQQALWVSRIIPTDAALVGSTENVVAMCLSINDWVTSAQSTSAATFQTSLTAMVDAIKAAAVAAGTPGFKIMLHSMTHVNSTLAIANDKGSTPVAFNTAIQAVATARSTFCTFLNLYNVCNDADMQDNYIHPSIGGHAKIYTAVLAAT